MAKDKGGDIGNGKRDGEGRRGYYSVLQDFKDEIAGRDLHCRVRVRVDETRQDWKWRS